MGWTSYLEDIVERLNEDLGKLERWQAGTPVTPRGLSTESDFRYEVNLWISSARAKLGEITAMLELATDPAVDVAAELATLRAEIAPLRERAAALDQAQVRAGDLAGKLACLQHMNQTLNSDRVRLDSEVVKLKTVITELSAEKKRLEKAEFRMNAKLERILATNSEALYDAYTTEDRIARHKPNP